MVGKRTSIYEEAHQVGLLGGIPGTAINLISEGLGQNESFAILEQEVNPTHATQPVDLGEMDLISRLSVSSIDEIEKFRLARLGRNVNERVVPPRRLRRG